ncbi:helix-turn-helix transcriptional regulator [Listeria rocourtiae]|uniref:helix-turn-helix transcriptional regulator n=1 Tax=Listeria TaxID=1637 RepID=UPI0016264A02|nr:MULTISPECIES: helix-turn-helix transcriptional regulator [Listeria]MBC1435964.1 helix-turn-helix transcriptional regulator [Listeria rocourtiae]MBC2080818.1 helix-turn-helix transcriptional regulator [Listeria booriae]
MSQSKTFTMEDMLNDIGDIHGKELQIQLQLSAKIKEIRRKNNITQAELAKLSNVPTKTISFLENGKSFPSIPTLLRLTESMGATLKISIR